MDEILIEGKRYVSSKQAAKITGYAKDYVGQLCREGRVEARLVGRNWYVLEDSIREHRFGAPEKEEAQEVSKAPEAPALTQDWQINYEAETVSYVPPLPPKPVSSSGPAIADMQSAWKEWFEEKRPSRESYGEPSPVFEQETATVSASEHTESEEETVDSEVSVSVSRITAETAAYEPEVPEEETEVELHRSYASMSTGERLPESSVPVVDLSPRTRAQNVARERSGNSSWKGVYRALLLVVAAIAALVALIGTGNADRFFAGTSLEYGAQGAIVDYLGGETTYEGTLK